MHSNTNNNHHYTDLYRLELAVVPPESEQDRGEVDAQFALIAVLPTLITGLEWDDAQRHARELFANDDIVLTDFTEIVHEDKLPGVFRVELESPDYGTRTIQRVGHSYAEVEASVEQDYSGWDVEGVSFTPYGTLWQLNIARGETRDRVFPVYVFAIDDVQAFASVRRAYPTSVVDQVIPTVWHADIFAAPVEGSTR